eukprot:m.404081 g.404081  ORF g.404081 m.404081 type:complete len:269 (+) comp16790_c3_seq1:74-880(+)
MVTTVRYILATAAAVTLPIGATSGTPAPAPPCKTDFDCSLNGHCESSGVCSCRLPWKDSTRGAVVEPCSVLDVQPHPNDYIPAYGGGLARKSTAWMEQNPSSWGGNMIFDRVDGKYHLYVSEMAGGKGLSSWHTASEIVHAVASDPLDQFVKQDTVLKPWAHNAAPILSPNGTYLVFHIGTGNVHASVAGPNGPWREVAFNVDCNNPAPAFHPNGTAFVMCHNKGGYELRVPRSARYDHAIPLLIAHIDYPLKVTPPYGWVLPDQRWS